MRLVTMTGGVSIHYGDKKAIELIKNAGFDGFDYTMAKYSGDFLDELNGKNYISYVKELKKISDDLNIPCLQSHAPDKKVPNEISIEEYLDNCKKSIEIANILGCKKIVIHPGNKLSDEENINLIYNKLIGFAGANDIIIATENMFGWKDEKQLETVPEACGTSESFINIIDGVNSPFLKACVDIGHAQMINCEGAVNIIKKLGKNRITCLHVHDNNLFSDDHVLPFIGDSDWMSIMKALNDIEYDCDFTFETLGSFVKFPKELIPSLLKILNDVGRFLISIK